MGSDIQTRQSAEILVSAPKNDERAAAVLSLCFSGAYREMGALVMMNFPTREQRLALARRQRELVDSLKHEKNKVRGLISEMLQGYRARGVRPNEDATRVVDLYVRELALEPKIPTWVVWRACGVIRMASDMARLEAAGITLYEAPTTMAMRRLCDSFMWDVRAELGKIGEVLQGRMARPETPPEERERVAKEFRALADDMKARLAEDRLDGPPPLTEDQLIELAGGEESFASIPNAKEYGKKFAPKLPDAPVAMAGSGDGNI